MFRSIVSSSYRSSSLSYRYSSLPYGTIAKVIGSSVSVRKNQSTEQLKTNRISSSFVSTPLSVRTMASSSSSSSTSSSSSSSVPVFETVSLQLIEEGILEIKLNRSSKMNAMNKRMWKEIELAFLYASEASHIRVILLTGEGNHFTSGLDLQDHLDLFTSSSTSSNEDKSNNKEDHNDVARQAFYLRKHIKEYQRNISSVEECPKPVIAIVHGACIGGGVDLISTADIRIASSDAFFSIKEAEIGLAADVGTLQRLPKIIGNDSIVRELVYTARRFSAEEAKSFGMLSNVFADRTIAMQHALTIARKIRSLSPVAIQGSKINLNFSRDHSVTTALEYQSAWNMGMLQTSDIPIAATGAMTKTVPVFPKL